MKCYELVRMYFLRPVATHGFLTDEKSILEQARWKRMTEMRAVNPVGFPELPVGVDIEDTSVLFWPNPLVSVLVFGADTLAETTIIDAYRSAVRRAEGSKSQ